MSSVHGMCLVDNELEPTSLVHIIRHGQALHNVDRDYPHRDLPLTDAGLEGAKSISTNMSETPDLIVISPMTRAIQTALNAFPSLVGSDPPHVDVQIWPDLREAHDAECNKGVSRREMSEKFPQFNFVQCSQEWDYPLHTPEGATARAENVRQSLQDLSRRYKNIALFTHRGFIAYLIQGSRYGVCEVRSYSFAEAEGDAEEAIGWGINVDTQERQDFGPTALRPRLPKTV